MKNMDTMGMDSGFLFTVLVAGKLHTVFANPGGSSEEETIKMVEFDLATSAETVIELDMLDGERYFRLFDTIGEACMLLTPLDENAQKAVTIVDVDAVRVIDIAQSYVAKAVRRQQDPSYKAIPCSERFRTYPVLESLYPF